jgi:hypothetical protein
MNIWTPSIDCSRHEKVLVEVMPGRDTRITGAIKEDEFWSRHNEIVLRAAGSSLVVKLRQIPLYLPVFP